MAVGGPLPVGPRLAHGLRPEGRRRASPRNDFLIFFYPADSICSVGTFLQRISSLFFPFICGSAGRVEFSGLVAAPRHAPLRGKMPLLGQKLTSPSEETRSGACGARILLTEGLCYYKLLIYCLNHLQSWVLLSTFAWSLYAHSTACSKVVHLYYLFFEYIYIYFSA